MRELKHWLDEGSEADEFERSILRSGLESDPLGTKRDQIWSNLMGALAVSPLGAVVTGAEATSSKAAAIGVNKASAVWLAVGKGFLLGLALYGAAAGVSEISEQFSAPHAAALTAQQATPPAQASTSGDEVLTAAPMPAITPSVEAPSTPRTGQRGSTRTPGLAPLTRETDLPSVASFEDSEHARDTRVSQLEAETRALRRAREELRQSKLVDAFATLEASRRQFSAPELYQEHEALMIELLYRSGQATAAERRAKAFLTRFPESPHAQQIRQFAPK